MSGRRSLMIAAGGMQFTPVDGESGVWIKSGGAVVSSGAKMVGVSVGSAQSQYIYSRGTAKNCIVLQSATQYVSNGGVASGCVLGGRWPVYQHITSGGSAIRCTYTNGCSAAVSNGGVARDCTLSGGVMNTLTGGTVENLTGSGSAAIGDYVQNGHGYLSGGTMSGGVLYFAWNGVGVDFTFNGTCNVFTYGNKGSVDGMVNGGRLVVSGGVVSGYAPAVDLPTERLNISSAQINFSDCVFSRGAIGVVWGKWGRNLTLMDSCSLVVYSGGVVSGLTISSGGTMTVSSGASALAVTSNAGATVTVLDGGYIEYVTE